MIKHLSIERRKRETFAATYGVVFGLVVHVVTHYGLGAPLWWLFDALESQERFAMMFLWFGLVFAIGIRVNGAWRWSPMFRVAGMAGMAGLMTFMSVMGLVEDGYKFLTAGVTYGFAATMYWILARGAVHDLHYYLVAEKLGWQNS